MISVLCVDPEFVGHNSTAWFDLHDLTEEITKLDLTIDEIAK